MMMRTRPTVLVCVLASGAALAASALPGPTWSADPLGLRVDRLALQAAGQPGQPGQAAPGAPGAPGQQTVIDVTLANPNFHPRLAVPDFYVSGGTDELRAAVRTVAEVLWADLDFEQEFYLIPREASAPIPVVATVDMLPIARWAELGADYVLMGTASPGGDGYTVDIRLVQTRGANPGRVSHAYRYQNCRVVTPRACAHFIADDFHKQARGLDGVAQTKLAFVSDRDAARMTNRLMADAGRGKEIYISDYDGFNQQRVTATQALTMGPAWSPDGRSLAYTSWQSGSPDVYINTLDGRPVSRPIQERVRPDDQNWLPAWSPDGEQIAFGSNRSGNNDIWVMNRDGSGLRNLTPNSQTSSEIAPTWSPDGRQIAFTSDRAGRTQIFIMNSADGSGLIRLTFELSADRPTWSPLGFIAYASGSGPGHTINLFDLRTMQPAVIVGGIGDNESPAVAPNGRHIAFTTTRWGREQIAIVNRRGENIRQITRDGNNQSANWSPARASN